MFDIDYLNQQIWYLDFIEVSSGSFLVMLPPESSEDDLYYFIERWSESGHGAVHEKGNRTYYIEFY